MAERRSLQFSSIDEVVTDVIRLRDGGYTKAGNWSLEQACWHLNQILRFVMRGHPVTPNTPEQDANRAMMEQVLANRALRTGITAPGMVVPPADTPVSAIDDFLATNEKLKTFAGPFATHRLFGNLPDATMRQLHLIHCAHHFSYLLPKD